MEEDIKVLKEKLNCVKKCNTYTYSWTDRDIEIVENLIARNKELEDADLTTVYLNGVYKERDKWKEKIKEKIEQLKIVRNAPVKDNHYTYKECIEYGIEELEELLQ